MSAGRGASGRAWANPMLVPAAPGWRVVGSDVMLHHHVEEKGVEAL